jgi:hypothetical protein
MLGLRFAVLSLPLGEALRLDRRALSDRRDTSRSNLASIRPSTVAGQTFGIEAQPGVTFFCMLRV